MELSIGISPCPNDVFIFEALMNKRIQDRDITFKFVLEDVETLNQMAIQGDLDITKLSFRAFFEVLEKYILLNSGSALGFGCGPLLISRDTHKLDTLKDKKIAVPGKWTTANFLLEFAMGQQIDREFMVFSEIEQAVIERQCEAGVIIHENRFTYQDKGLHLVQDLGQYWEQHTQAPIPLGGIAIRRAFPHSIQKKVEKLIWQSLTLAFENPEAAMPAVALYSQEMDTQVMKSHIQLYVNEFSLNLGEIGRKAVNTMAEKILSSPGQLNQHQLILK